MSKVMFISDLHLGHKNLVEGDKKKKFLTDFRAYREGNTIDEHNHILIEKIARSVTKRDILYILGDVVVFSKDIELLHLLNEIPCELRLVRGNHDRFSIEEYLKVFTDIEGIVKYKKSWLTHCPIHPMELRNRINIHGHTHVNNIMQKPMDPGDDEKWDRRYVNVSVECLNGYPISYQDIINGKYWKLKQV